MSNRCAKESVLRALSASLAAILLMGLAPAAHAAEFCVRCSGPDQTYRCKVTGVSSQYSDAAKLFCVLQTTKQEGHAKCTASLDPACKGIEKVYDYNGPALPQALDQNAAVKKYKNRVTREQEKFASPEEEGRATLFDLGKGMISGTRSRLGYGSDETPAPSAPPSQTTAPTAVPQAAVPPASGQLPPVPERAVAAQAPENDESFAHRSYRCLKSFFFNCGSEDAAN